MPWFVPEITPTVPTAGPHRQDLDAVRRRRATSARSSRRRRWRCGCTRAGSRRGRRRSARPAAPPRTATILQVIADVFDADGRAHRAAQRRVARRRAARLSRRSPRRGERCPWDEVVAGFTAPDAGAARHARTRERRVYAALLPEYEAFESLSSDSPWIARSFTDVLIDVIRRDPWPVGRTSAADPLVAALAVDRHVGQHEILHAFEHVRRTRRRRSGSR